MATFANDYAMRIVYLHYSADPDKDEAWAAKERASMPSAEKFEKEYEINFSATAGQLVFALDDEATLEKPFPIPESWTRYFALDPHPRVPHAGLWCAVDPHGDRWYYRELWPSKICGKAGRQPEDDTRHTIKEYCSVIKYLESTENPENGHLQDAERIYRRVIDYAARGMGQGTIDDPEMPNFQNRYEATLRDLGIDVYRFEDAKKDINAGIEQVNAGLKPLSVEDLKNPGGFIRKSRVHIFADRCPELLWELRNNRWKRLTALQAETHDPSGQPIEARKHMTDCMRYIEMANPEYVAPLKFIPQHKPRFEGTSY